MRSPATELYIRDLENELKLARQIVHELDYQHSLGNAHLEEAFEEAREFLNRPQPAILPEPDF